MKESHRAAFREMELGTLRENVDRLCLDYHLKLHLLGQHVRRVAELECRLALLGDGERVEERHLRWASDVRRALEKE